MSNYKGSNSGFSACGGMEAGRIGHAVKSGVSSGEPAQGGESGFCLCSPLAESGFCLCSPLAEKK